MIDIHAHILPNVDDGSHSFEESILMLKKAAQDGVKHQFLTPHVYSRASKVSPEGFNDIFLELKRRVKLENIDIQLYLGHELHYKSHIDIDYDRFALNQTKYVLIEFSFTQEAPIEEIVYDLSRLGYIPIVAHIERYLWLDYKAYKKIKHAGALLQVNTQSILNNGVKKIQKKVIHHMFKEKLVDFVATDAHSIDLRPPNMKEAYTYLSSFVDPDYLNQIFYTNALPIISKTLKV